MPISKIKTINLASIQCGRCYFYTLSSILGTVFVRSTLKTFKLRENIPCGMGE
nr:MAG TPA: hypothetical protein [Caudoviricetes sp.]